jgi:hypothetical protein
VTQAAVVDTSQADLHSAADIDKVYVQVVFVLAALESFRELIYCPAGSSEKTKADV